MLIFEKIIQFILCYFLAWISCTFHTKRIEVIVQFLFLHTLLSDQPLNNVTLTKVSFISFHSTPNLFRKCKCVGSCVTVLASCSSSLFRLWLSRSKKLKYKNFKWKNTLGSAKSLMPFLSVKKKYIFRYIPFF